MLRKSWMKRLTVFVLAAFCVTLLPSPAFAAVPEQTPLEKLSAVEKILYGMEQTGSLVERTNKLERELFGTPGRDALMSKVNKIYVYVRETSPASPSLVFKLGALEWSLTQSVVKGPVVSRLDALEKTVNGVGAAGSIDVRILRLMTITFSGGRMQVGQATLNKDTLVKIKTVMLLDSKKNRAGDPVEFEAAEDVYASGMLIIPKGAIGMGKLAKVESAQNFGRDAKMEVSFETVEALDMTKVPTLLGEKAKEETKSMAGAAGASVAGMILLGPIGVVGAAFVHGKNISIPAGTMLFIQTQSDVEVVGLIAK